MFSTKKPILAAVAVFGTVSFAQATSFDPNLANRYPSYAQPGAHGRDVSLPRQTPPFVADELWADRASRSFSGGGY